MTLTATLGEWVSKSHKPRRLFLTQNLKARGSDLSAQIKHQMDFQTREKEPNISFQFYTRAGSQ